MLFHTILYLKSLCKIMELKEKNMIGWNPNRQETVCNS